MHPPRNQRCFAARGSSPASSLTLAAQTWRFHCTCRCQKICRLCYDNPTTIQSFLVSAQTKLDIGGGASAKEVVSSFSTPASTAGIDESGSNGSEPSAIRDPDNLQHEVLAARCGVQPVPCAPLTHLGRNPESSVGVQHERRAARSAVQQVLTRSAFSFLSTFLRLRAPS